MNKILILILSSFICSSNIVDTIWVDKSLSEIKWTGNKISGSHNGKISIKNGYIIKNNDLLIGGEIIVDMNSISVDDRESYLAPYAQLPVLFATSANIICRALAVVLSLQLLAVSYPMDVPLRNCTISSNNTVCGW